jgi:hypothetical protein
MNKKKVLLILFSVFLLSAMAAASVIAQPRIAGVYEGDWFEYGDINVSWSSSDPNATTPYYLEDLNKTEWMLISILNVSNTNVTVQAIMRYKNGTEQTTGGYVDVDTGDFENWTMWIISANLNENDTLYTSGMYTLYRINETIIRTYPDGARETNHVNITAESNITGFYQHQSMNYYWDRQVGAIVEISQNSTLQEGENVETSSLSIRITDSDVWVIPEYPTWIPIILTLTMITTATISLKKLRTRVVYRKS